MGIFWDSTSEKLEKSLSIDKDIQSLKQEIYELSKYLRFADSSYKNKLHLCDNELKKGGSSDIEFIKKRIEERDDSYVNELKKSIIEKNIQKANLEKSLDVLMKSKKVEKLYKSEKELQQLGYSYESIKEAFQQGVLDKDEFKVARKKVEKKLGNKVHYSDVLVFNKKGELLLLQRTDDDDMFPSQWCLPGGHVDPGEEGIFAAARELEEETLIDTDEDIVKVHELTKNKAFIEYFEVNLNNTPTIALNAREHQGYEWVSLDKIGSYDLIADLKSVLLGMFNIEKGIRAVIGEKRKWKDGFYIKTTDGWKPETKSIIGNKNFENFKAVVEPIFDKKREFDYKDESFPSELLDNELKLGGKLFREYVFPEGVESGNIYGDKTIEKFCEKNGLDYKRVKEFTQTSTGKGFFWNGVYSKYNIDDIQFFIENSDDGGYWSNYLNNLPDLNWNGYIPSPKTLAIITKNTEQNKPDYEHIRKTADEIIRGSKHIERLSPKEEQGRIKGGRVNVEATLLLRGTEVTSSEDGEGVAELVTAQEKILEDYAKDNGLWVEHSTIEKDWKFLDNGEEAKMYRIDDSYVNKVYDYQVMSLSPLEFIDNRISLHNFMFEGTSYELTGFTKTKRGLSFIVKQPYIRNYSKTPIDNIRKEMEKRGFKKLDNKSYYNDNYLVEDLHEKNVITKDDTGKLYFIDTVISLNEIGEGYGGVREYRNIDVVDNKIEKAFQTIKLGFEQGLVSQEIFEKAQKVYADNAENRKLQRVGKPWGVSGEEQTSSPKTKKADDQNDGESKSPEEHAKSASEKALIEASKNSTDPEVRTAAHKELKRRESEEKNTSGDGEKNASNDFKKEADVKPNDKQETSFDTKESVENEIRRLREIDTYDIDEITEINNKISELMEKRKTILPAKSSERKVLFDEYRKGFKSFTKEDVESLKAYKFYEKDAETSRNYLLDNKDSLIAANTYIGNGYKAIRNYLADPDNYDNEAIGSSMDKDTVEKVSNDLSKFINSNKITENVSLSRRIKGDAVNFFKGLEKGDVYEDKSFSSTSIKELDHFGEYNIEILAKKGSSVSNIDNSSELEYIIDRGSKFRVLDKSETGMIVELL